MVGPDLTTSFESLGIALGLGLLVGLERETAGSSPRGGLRTFALITVLGCLCGMVTPSFGPWIIPAGMVSIAALTMLSNYAMVKSGAIDPGMTTEIAMIVMYLDGAYLVAGHRGVAIAIGGGVAVLLQAKERMHGAVKHLHEDDLKAIMRFVLIALVILPALPNRTFGPFGVLNLRDIWFMVVLIVGISLAGYVTYRFFGSKAGTVTAGILGGIISSTATTVSFSRRTKSDPKMQRVATVVVMIASTIVLIRVLIEIAVVAPSFLAVASGPIGVMLGVMALLSALSWRRTEAESAAPMDQESPSELGTAILFGALYALVLLAVAFAKEHYERGLYVVSALAGLTDVDAITLSTAQLVEANRLDASQGWRLIVIANISNLVFKAMITAVLGTRRLFATLAGLYAIAIAAGIALILFWPS